MEAYVKVFSNGSTYKALGNTLIVSVGALLLAWLVGGGLAFLTEKTDIGLKKFIRFFIFLEFCIPPYIFSVSWVQITSRGGYLNRLIKLFSGDFQYTFSPYSLGAVMIVLALHLSPLVFFGISNVLRKNNEILENAGRMSGASSFHILKTITLPLVFPAFLSTGLLIFSRAIANFEIAALLAMPVGKEVLTTKVYKAISALDLQTLSVLSLLLIAVSYVFYSLSEGWLKKHTFSVNRTQKTGKKHLVALGKLKYILYPVLFLYFTTILIFPLITLILSSFMKRWGLQLSLHNMTFNNYFVVLFGNALIRRGFFNSLFYGVVSASLATVFALITVFFYKHIKSRPSRLLMGISGLPLSIPNIALAICAIFAWINPPFKLYGTKWIFIVTYTALFIPIMIEQMKGIAENISPAFDTSARTLGIPITGRIIKLFLPQLSRGLMTGWMLSFLIALREIPISLLLTSKGNETIGVVLFTIQSNSYGMEMTSTVAIFVILISVVGNLVINKFINKKSVAYENITDE
ncbi:MAG: iron ABC transporter permease [Anaerotignum sp.]|nr:iron ABC transporter permease [Anaerotignum sp.]